MNAKYNLKTEAEQKRWEKQEDIWFELYMTFNDDNYTHCANAFDSQGFETPEDVENDNYAFIKEIMAHGHTLKEVADYVPIAKPIIEKYFDKGGEQNASEA